MAEPEKTPQPPKAVVPKQVIGKLFSSVYFPEMPVCARPGYRHFILYFVRTWFLYALLFVLFVYVANFIMVQVRMCVNLRIFYKKCEFHTRNGRVYLQFIDFCPLYDLRTTFRCVYCM